MNRAHRRPQRIEALPPQRLLLKGLVLILCSLGLVCSLLAYQSLDRSPAPMGAASVLPVGDADQATSTDAPTSLPAAEGDGTAEVVPGRLLEAYPKCDRNEYLALPAGRCIEYPKCGEGKYLDRERRTCRRSPDCRYRQMLAPNKRECVKDPRKTLHDVPEERVRWVNANIKSGIVGWREDFLRVVAARPDFITLQEMNRHTDAELAIEGYAIYRSHDSPFTSETPVLWDTRRWDALETGTRYLTTRQVLWGIRAVNWVVLRSKTTGRVVSVLSAHPAPTLKRTEGLLPIFISRLMPIVEDLYGRGDVLVGGDFNAHYGASLWTKSGLPNTTLRSTFSAFGKFATGEHRGATIDYMFERESDTITPLRHGWWNGNSDHHALWSEWKLSSPARLVRADLRDAILRPAAGVNPAGAPFTGR